MQALKVVLLCAVIVASLAVVWSHASTTPVPVLEKTEAATVSENWEIIPCMERTGSPTIIVIDRFGLPVDGMQMNGKFPMVTLPQSLQAGSF